MSAQTRALQPEVALRQPVNFKLNRGLRQWAPFTRAICICGHQSADGVFPSARMLARMEHACNLIDDYDDNVLVIASGGLTRASNSGLTEAQGIDFYLRARGFHGLFREEFATESVGNVSLSFLAFLTLFEVPIVTFVTDSPHADRMNVFARHILQGRIQAEISIAPWPLSPEEEIEEVKIEADGWKFVNRFLEEVPPGMPKLALKWISENHRSNPYRGLDVEKVVAAMRGQVLDFNALLLKPS